MLEKIVNAVEKVRPKKASQSWMWLLLIPLMLVGIMVAAWVAGRDRRELAKLRHAKNKARIESENATADAKVAKNEAEVDAAMARVLVAEKKILDIDTRMHEAGKEYAKNKARIDRLRWTDLPAG